MTQTHIKNQASSPQNDTKQSPGYSPRNRHQNRKKDQQTQPKFIQP